MNRVAKRNQKTLARRATRNRNDRPANGFGTSAGAVPARRISELLQAGIQLHQAGRLQDAEPVYRQILDIDPGHADASHLLGGLAHQAGDYVQAAKLISRALATAPNQPLFHAGLLDRWNVLDEFGDYPNMLTPLDIDGRVDGLANRLE